MPDPDAPPPTSAVERDFPYREVSRLAASEAYNKHHYRPTNYGHKWWARRLGSVVRSLCLASLADPDTTAAEVWRRHAEPNDFSDALVVDPFMGGGTTGQEATRLGAKFVGVDVNPVAWFVARMGLAPPPEEADEAFADVLDRARAAIRPFYRTACPDCDEDVGASFYLWVELAATEDGPVRAFDSLVVDHAPDGGATVVCPDCGALADVADPERASCAACGAGFDATRSDTRVPTDDPGPTVGGDGRPTYEPYAVKHDCPDCGAGFARFDAGDARRYRAACATAARRDLPVPDQPIPDGVKTRDLRTRGYERWRELFNPRQRLALGSLLAAVDEVGATRPRHYLALALSAALEFNCMLCSYKGADPRGPGAVRHVFSHHAFVHPSEPLENNPLGTRARQSGTVPTVYDYRLKRAFEFQERPVERVLGDDGRVAEKRAVPGERVGGDPASSVRDLVASDRTHYLVCGDGADLSVPPGVEADAVVTDPPYYDSVQYAELADFFYVWLKQTLEPDFPDAFAGDSGVADAEAVGNRARDQSLDDYAHLLERVFSAAGATLKPDGPLVFTFHHGDAAAWGALLSALDGAGFRVVAAYPVRGENRRSVHIAGQRAIRLDSAVVCRRPADRGVGAWADVRDRVKEAARERLTTIRDAEGDLSALDASVVVRGACLVQYSAHERVLDGDETVSPREAVERVAPVTERLNDERL